MALLQTPYIIYGRATDRSGAVITGEVVTLRNENSGEEITFVTDANGDYVFDCANFPSGWADGDILALSTGGIDEDDFEFYVSHNGGLSWYQVDNKESYSFDINGLKIKIDQTNYPNGRIDARIIYPI